MDVLHLTIVLFLLLSSGIAQSQDNVTTDSSTASINIPPLIILEPPKNVLFCENEAIQLPCAASGNPPPTYHWLYNDAPFDPSGNDGRIALQPGVGTLIFARPIARDEAFYQCLATNIVGTALSVKISLRQAMLEPFRVPSTRINSPTLGSSLTLNCTPPRSFPKANVFWAIMFQDQRFSPIDLSDRVTVDPIGNLQFVNIVAEDAQSGQTYTCVAENKIMRSIQQGEFNTIRPQGVVPKLYPPSPLWQSPTQQVALRGESWNVMCVFSGNPTPRVTWLKTDGALSSRARLESFGQTLVIDSVLYDDAGSYECQGINDEAMIPVRRSFTLNIESAPYWRDKPESVDVGENDTATITCSGEGIPHPTTFWLLNGVPISRLPSDPRRVIGLRDLTFYNVTTKDAQVVQCKITNKHGYNFTNAYVNVYSEPAKILEGPQIDQRAAEGQTVYLTCQVFGSPKPQIVWLKGQEQLTGGRFTIMDKGDLQITDVSLVDAGTYTCTAKNRLGFAQATGTLLVRMEATNRCCQVNSAVTVGSSTTFSCCTAAKIDSRLQFNYYSYISGTQRLIYNGETLGPESQNHFEIIHDEWTKLPTLRLISATLNNSGKYECEDVTEGIQNNKESYLSVIDPSCWLIENETLQLGCDVIFTGSVPPTINCSTQHSASVPNRTIVSFNESATSTMMYRQDIESTVKLNGAQISCNVYVDWSSIVDQSQRCINTSLSHVYTWASQPIIQWPQDPDDDTFTTVLGITVTAVLAAILTCAIIFIIVVRHRKSQDLQQSRRIRGEHAAVADSGYQEMIQIDLERSGDPSSYEELPKTRDYENVIPLSHRRDQVPEYANLPVGHVVTYANLPLVDHHL